MCRSFAQGKALSVGFADSSPKGRAKKEDALSVSGQAGFPLPGERFPRFRAENHGVFDIV